MKRGRFIAFSLLIMLAALGRQIGKKLSLALIVEALLIFGMLYLLARYQPFVDIFNRLNRFYRWSIVVFLALFLIGHLSHKSHRTFPFVTWTIYGEPEKAPPVFYDYIGKFEDGTTFHLVPARIIPSLAKSRIDNRLRRQIREIQHAKNPNSRAKLMNTHQVTLTVFARLYNQKHANLPIQSIEVTECVIPLDGYNGETSIKRELLWEIQVK